MSHDVGDLDPGSAGGRGYLTEDVGFPYIHTHIFGGGVDNDFNLACAPKGGARGVAPAI